MNTIYIDNRAWQSFYTWIQHDDGYMCVYVEEEFRCKTPKKPYLNTEINIGIQLPKCSYFYIADTEPTSPSPYHSNTEGLGRK